MLIQAFIAELPIEAFDEGILNGFTRLDEAQLHLSQVSPRIQGLAGELRPVVPS
jgi:hypothetical protein